MYLQIETGLFKYDLIDHYAILGVPVDADGKEIRKRYLQIARRLHPDKFQPGSDSDKEVASELLSKLVNPAYEKLSGERNRVEYLLVLSQTSRRLIQDADNLPINTELAQNLMAASNVETLYKSAIAKIAETQYDQLSEARQMIAQVSELNLVYLMKNAGKIIAQPQTSPQSFTNAPAPTSNTPPAPTQSPIQVSVVEQYLRRAQTLIEKNQFAQAKVELQDALKLEPKNHRSHSLMAVVYLRQNQLKMAKVHFDNALKLNPKDKLALEWKPKVDKALGIKPSDNQVKTSPQSGEKQPEKSGSGGLFGGLFGGKKK
ncbi:heat shock protein DnaJ domain protein [Richelia sinica FACHB-800]|uniref:Heat shock protein DnaJ domain protein n=1 Tax=Richelia sinica FACHB-800 TaxID=1357546 RepID=A0A975T736_9NOST|nr:J domain-containing protein [Richelia sinica]MBD2664638.1 J domain-containing protein [Richelia sinica FACHB-800]QXE23275.1 heat shock protein DnaJ domain protein [Richelia sinica FACHB-800]